MAAPTPIEVPKAEEKIEPKVEPKVVEAAKPQPPKPAPPPAITPVAAQKAAADRRLKLRFKGESWVEIKDRSGRVLLSRLNPPGSEAEVSGRPPFAVVIGNAPLVEMLYEDREFPLEPHTRVAVARFTVE